MRYNAPQFAPTFPERVKEGKRQFVKEHRYMGFLASPVCFVILMAHRFAMLFFNRAKKLSGIVLVSAAFAVTSSFAFPVLTMRSGFVSLDAGRQVMAAGSETASAAAGMSENPQAGESSVDFADEIRGNVDELVDVSLLDADGGDDAASQEEAGEAESFVSGDESGLIMDDAVYSIDELIDMNGREWMLSDEEEADRDSGFDPADWRLTLLNKQHPIPEDYSFELETFSESMRCDKRIVRRLLDMIYTARDDGVSLIPCSPYRTHSHQTELFDRKIDRYMDAGYSYMDSFTRAAQAVTVPGTSEHEVGLAIDFITENYSQLNEGFADTAAGAWLRERSPEFGFILRYPKGKEDITGIEYEPWHFRYVGRDAATIITQEGLCLEEFWDRYIYR
ncbi:MAG: M15 family metallopeptidase [Lachnospiraceae bacterium]|nr:M15 family metallopeptidase [Lachnospiraceae bacterium]